MTTRNLQVSVQGDDSLAVVFNGTLFFTTTSTWFGAGEFDFQNRQHEGLALFKNAAIPQGSNIDASTMTIQALFTDSVSGVRTDFYCEDVDDADPVSSKAAYSALVRTDATVPWDDIESFTAGVNYTSVDFKSVIQEVISRPGWASGNNILLIWGDAPGDSASNAFRNGKSYNSSSSAAPKLAVDFTVGTDVLGQAVITGTGSFTSAGSLTLPGSAAFAGIGTMVVAGNIGTVHLGAAVIAGVGDVVAVGTMELAGKAVLNGVGSVVAVGERGTLGAAILSGVGTLTAIGEITTQLEGRATISGVGSLVAVGERGVEAAAVMSGVGTLSPVGVIEAVGAAAMTGVGTMSVIGETGAILFTIFGGVKREIDPADYPTGSSFFFEATLAAPAGGTARARLFNITTAAEVTDSEVTTAVVEATRLRSVALTLASGENVYRVEYGGASGDVYTVFAAALLVESS